MEELSDEVLICDVLIRRQDCFKVIVTGHFNPPADGKLTGSFQTGISIRFAEIF